MINYRKAGSLLLTALFALSTLFAQKADDIIRKNLSAMGGEANWQKIQSIKMDGMLNAGGTDIPVSISVVRDMGWRMDMTVMGKIGYTVVTPTRGWSCKPPDATNEEPMPDDKLKQYQGKLKMKDDFLMDRTNISNAEYTGIDTANHLGCYKLKITDKQGKEESAYFDTLTYYVVRLEMVQMVRGQQKKVVLNYGNYIRQTEGIVYPMKQGTVPGDIIVKALALNKPVDAALFQSKVTKTK